MLRMNIGLVVIFFLCRLLSSQTGYLFPERVVRWNYTSSMLFSLLMFSGGFKMIRTTGVNMLFKYIILLTLFSNAIALHSLFSWQPLWFFDWPAMFLPYKYAALTLIFFFYINIASYIVSWGKTDAAEMQQSEIGEGGFR